MAAPCEMLAQPDCVTVILRPGISQCSWTEVEAFGAEVREEMERRKAPVCLIDLSPMTYMGSAIVALIVRIWKTVQTHGGKMVVLCPNPAVLEVIRLAGLDKIWTISSSPEDARRILGLRSPSVTGQQDGVERLTNISKSRMLYFVLGAVTALLILMLLLLFLANRG